MEYASKGVAGAGLGTGIAGLSLGVLNAMGGLASLGGGLGIAPRAEMPQFVTKDELAMAQQLSAKDSEIAILKADNDTDRKLVDVYAKLESRDKEIWQVIADVKERMCNERAAQGIVNAQVGANIAVNQNNIQALQTLVGSITKTIIPIDSVCPEPMPAKNSWTAPTATAATPST